MGNHFAHLQESEARKLEKIVRPVRVEKHVSLPDARKLVAETPVVVGKSHTAAAKGSTRSVSMNSDLTGRYHEAKYKKDFNCAKNCKTKYKRCITTEG